MEPGSQNSSYQEVARDSETFFLRQGHYIVLAGLELTEICFSLGALGLKACMCHDAWPSLSHLDGSLRLVFETESLIEHGV